MTIDNIQSGEYVLGMWDEEHAAINENNSDLNINIYPNPAKYEINIDLKKEIQGQLTITNQLGQIVKKHKIDGNEMKLDITNIPSGIYHVNIIDKKGKLITSEKIVK